MAFPINDLLASFLEALDLHLKLSAGSGRNSSHGSIMCVSAEFVLSLAAPPQGGTSWCQLGPGGGTGTM